MRIFTRIKNALTIPVFLFLLTAAFSQQAFASHMAGGDIEYRNIAPYKWIVKLTVYRYCEEGAVMLCTNKDTCPQTMTAVPSIGEGQMLGALNPSVCTANPSSLMFQLKLISVTDVQMDNIERCGLQSKNGCTNLGQVAPGVYKPSVEKYIFEGVLNMNIPSLVNNSATCPYWDIGWSHCCRNSTVNVNDEPLFYIKATLNIFEAQAQLRNNSPVFKREGVFTFCAGQELMYNMGTFDPDGDSLTYRICKSLGGANTPVSYNAPFSERYPFPLQSTSPPHNKYPGLPFIVIDSLNGDISLNANNPTTQPIGGQICVEVTQWRYKADRTPYVVGISMRDLQTFSLPCLGNKTPQIQTNPTLPNGSPRYDWEVCAGEKICFEIIAKDEDNMSVSNPSRIDSTQLSWDSSIVRPGMVTFQPAYNPAFQPREDVFNFCWQTALSDISTLPYFFTVKGIDNFCPTPGKITRAFSIKVNKQPKADLVKRNLSCGKWEVKVRKTDITHAFSSATLEIANQPGDYTFSGGKKTVFSGNPNPSGTGSGPLSVIVDSLQFKQPGKYYMRYTITSAWSSCAFVSYDSIQVSSGLINVTLEDTFKCKTGTVTLSANTSGGSGTLQYKWFRNFFTLPVHTSSANQFTIDDSLSASYHVYVTDSNGCGARDTMQLTVKRINGEIISVNDSAQCLTANAFTFNHSPVTLFSNYTRLWMSEQSTSSDAAWNKSYSSAGSKPVDLVISEPGGCSDTAHKTVHVWPMPSKQNVLHVNDSIQCLDGNHFIITYQLSNNPEHYRHTWAYDTLTLQDSITLDFSSPVAGTAQVKLILETINGCFDTAGQQLTVKPSPAPLIQGQQANIILDDEHDYSVTALAGSSYRWNVVNGIFVGADTTAAVRVKWNVLGEGKLHVKQSLDECSASDSIQVTVGTSGLNESGNIEALSISPNPNNGTFTIKLQARTRSKAEIKLYNAIGGTVLTQHADLASGSNEVSVHCDVPAGIYLLIIQEQGGLTTRKVIIK